MPSMTVAPRFTRCHYTAVADAIYGTYDQLPPTPIAWRFAAEQVAQSLAALFVEDNPRFDSQRFLAACGICDF
jgi:hypothetical protein